MKELLGRDPTQQELDDWIKEFYPDDETTSKDDTFIEHLREDPEDKPNTKAVIDSHDEEIIFVPPTMDDPLKNVHALDPTYTE